MIKVFVVDAYNLGAIASRRDNETKIEYVL